MYQDDELSGILTVVSIKEVHLPDQEELSLLMGVRYQARLALANAQLIQKLKTSQERLRMLSARLVEIQESERRFLARKLHDDIGQALTSLSFNLELIARNAHKVGALKGIVEPMGEIRDQVNGLLQMVRNLSLDLRPALLDDLGLLPALLDYFERFTIETGVRVNLKRSGLTERLDPQVETSVFRIFQEALQNVAHHAQTGAVDVLIWADAKMLGAKIQDAGMGFNVPVTELTARAGGLSRMSERVLSCGGQLEIESKPGRGTTLTLEIPLQPGNTTEEKT
jgi:signal transduction histidine kinase